MRRSARVRSPRRGAAALLALLAACAAGAGPRAPAVVGPADGAPPARSASSSARPPATPDGAPARLAARVDGASGACARVVALDGVVLAEPAPGATLELAPGAHELVLECRVGERSATVRARVALRPGRAYVLALGIDADGAPAALVVEAGG